MPKIFLFYLIEDDDQEKDIKRGTRQTNVGEVVEKFKHFDHVLFQVCIHLTNRRKITKFLSYQLKQNLAKPLRYFVSKNQEERIN
jgi:hypothetical protein